MSRLFLTVPPILNGKSQKSRRVWVPDLCVPLPSAGSKGSNLERHTGGMFAANVPKNPYMKTDFRIKCLKALEQSLSVKVLEHLVQRE